VINVVGDHASYHLEYDAPLTSDVPAHARICSVWLRVSGSADELASLGAEAVAAASEGAGKTATLIVQANHAWETSDAAPATATAAVPTAVEPGAIGQAAAALSGGGASALLLGADALLEENLAIAGRIAQATGARLLCETFPARLQRGAGRCAVERVPYFAEQVQEHLAGLENLVLVGAAAPVSFFAYPGKASWLVPEGCEVIDLAGPDHDLSGALATLADELGADAPPQLRAAAAAISPPAGPLTPAAIGQSLTLLMPPDTIVSDEAATCGLGIFPVTEQAPPHDWLTLTGGAIGLGLPLSLGAAIACPERKVIALQADGSAMYTVQALWSMVREQADVTVVIMNNRSYAILNIELARVGAGQPTPKTLSMLDLSRPNIDWVSLAEGMGVPATRATSAEEFHGQLQAALAERGPRLIEAMVVQQMP
jgi:acetolactate synthase-1/2/3 large subunit